MIALRCSMVHCTQNAADLPQLIQAHDAYLDQIVEMVSVGLALAAPPERRLLIACLRVPLCVSLC